MKRAVVVLLLLIANVLVRSHKNQLPEPLPTPPAAEWLKPDNAGERDLVEGDDRHTPATNTASRQRNDASAIEPENKRRSSSNT